MRRCARTCKVCYPPQPSSSHGRGNSQRRFTSQRLAAWAAPERSKTWQGSTKQRVRASFSVPTKSERLGDSPCLLSLAAGKATSEPTDHRHHRGASLKTFPQGRLSGAPDGIFRRLATTCGPRSLRFYHLAWPRFLCPGTGVLSLLRRRFPGCARGKYELNHG